MAALPRAGVTLRQAENQSAVQCLAVMCVVCSNKEVPECLKV